MVRRICLTLLGCLLAIGCTDATAPTLSNVAGTWRATFSMSATVASDTFNCSGQLDLTLTQTDTVLSGTYAALPPSYAYCGLTTGPSQPSVRGWNWGFLAPYTVNGVARASGDFRLAVAVTPSDDPHSLVLVGRGTAGGWAGTASSVLVVYSDGGTYTNVPLAGTFILQHP